MSFRIDDKLILIDSFQFLSFSSYSLVNLIQDGSFWGSSQMGESKKVPSLEYVTHILQW